MAWWYIALFLAYSIDPEFCKSLTANFSDKSSHFNLPNTLLKFINSNPLSLAWIAINVILPCTISEPAGFPRVFVSPVISIKSSINWKHNPRFKPHFAIFFTISVLASESIAPVLAHVSNIALVFPAIIAI